MQRELSQSEQITEKLKEALDKYLGNRPDAYNWLFMYNSFCHAIDDIIDIPERRNDNEFILYVFNKALDVFSHQFYQQHINRLYDTVKIIHNAYADTLLWEHETVEWKAKYADVMRSCANKMISTVVEIVVTEETKSMDLGYEAKRQISILAREKSWLDHHTEDGKPI